MSDKLQNIHTCLLLISCEIANDEASALGSKSRLAGIERATGDSPRRSKPIYNTYGDAASPERDPGRNTTLFICAKTQFHMNLRYRSGKNFTSSCRKAKGANCVRFHRFSLFIIEINVYFESLSSEIGDIPIYNETLILKVVYKRQFVALKHPFRHSQIVQSDKLIYLNNFVQVQ